MKSSQWSLQEVTEPLTHEFDGTVVEVQVGGEKIYSTDNHPFWVSAGHDLDKRPAAEDVKGNNEIPTDTSLGRWVSARDLHSGDTFLLKDGKQAKIEAILTKKEKTRVYNLTVGDTHTYAVGNQGILVHNKACFSSSVGGSTTAGSTTSSSSGSTTSGSTSSSSSSSSAGGVGGSTSSSSSSSTSSGSCFSGNPSNSGCAGLTCSGPSCSRTCFAPAPCGGCANGLNCTMYDPGSPPNYRQWACTCAL